jgi:hypothetical protein
MLFKARDSFCWKTKQVSDTVGLRFIYNFKTLNKAMKEKSAALLVGMLRV